MARYQRHCRRYTKRRNRRSNTGHRTERKFSLGFQEPLKPEAPRVLIVTDYETERKFVRSFWESLKSEAPWVIVIALAMWLAVVTQTASTPPQPPAEYPPQSPPVIITVIITVIPTNTPEPMLVSTPEPNPPVTGSTYCSYIVQPGDTLTDIARRFQTTVDEILQLNPLEDPDLIYPGQELKIPPNTSPD